MKFSIWIAIILGFFSCSKPHHVVITAVNVFDGERVFKNVDFVFSAQGIYSISKAKKKHHQSIVIDGSGKTILPPLINAHVHVRSSENLKESQNAGIFGVLDMFSTDIKANNLRTYRDSLAYSKFYSSNVGATPPGGHGTQFKIIIPTINDTLSPRQFVRDRIAQNADYIKITHEASMSRLDTSHLRELIDETHRQNKIAVAHISDLKNGMDVVRQNVDGLAHIWYRSNSISTENDLKVMKEKGIFIIPTLSVISKLITYAEEIGLEEDYLSMEQLKEEVRKVKAQGICILAGTDSPNFNMDYSSQYFEELLLLKACGLSEIEVLQSATKNIYDKFSLEAYDLLKPNNESSFILVTGKPYLDIRDLMNQKRIWKNGIEITS